MRGGKACGSFSTIHTAGETRDEKGITTLVLELSDPGAIPGAYSNARDQMGVKEVRVREGEERGF